MSVDCDKFVISIHGTQIQYLCSSNESILHALARQGIKGLPVGCRGGACGVCKVKILSGSYISKKMSRSQISESEQSRNVVLACRVLPTSDMTIDVIGQLSKAVSKTISWHKGLQEGLLSN